MTSTGTAQGYILDEGLTQFDTDVADQLRRVLDRLLNAPKSPRGEHPRGSIPAEAGVYLFSGVTGQPVYVGQSRNLRARLAQHCRKNAGHNSASFAYNIAKRNAGEADIIIAGSRAEVSVHADFVEHFHAAKLLVAQMPVQFVTEDDAALRTVFEVYATYALGTHEYNTFETH